MFAQTSKHSHMKLSGSNLKKRALHVRGLIWHPSHPCSTFERLSPLTHIVALTLCARSMVQVVVASLSDMRNTPAVALGLQKQTLNLVLMHC